MERSNIESFLASGKKRAQEARTYGEAERTTSSEAERTASSEAETSKKANIPQSIYVILYTEGGSCPEFKPEIIGLYSSKTLAIQSAKVAFENKTYGKYQNGGWTEPRFFEKTKDNTERVGDEGILLFQEDREDYWQKISIEKKQLDVTNSPLF
jgi:hypothetical protein